jgi:hypothetical protein
MYPEIWMDYADVMQRVTLRQLNNNQEAAVAEARKIWIRAMEALPSSTLIHFEYSLFLECNLQLQDAGVVYEMMIERDSFPDTDKQLAIIHQLLFVRRTRGMEEARRHSVHALKSPYSSWQLYVVAARIELFMNREALPARKVFEFGMRSYGKHVPYLLQYISTLYSMNEEGNMRVMFDTFMKDDALRFNRELWDEYLRFEICYGNRVAIDNVTRRRAEALGNAVDPNGIYGSLNRFKVLDLFPASPDEIRAMSLGINVMLKDGSRGDAEESANKRAALRQSSASSMLLSSDRGNPLKVLFRDPEHLQELPRPVLSGEGSGLTMYTREIAVGATMPGQDGAVVPAGLLDLVALLPAAHEYNGPKVNVEAFMGWLTAVELPGPPLQEAASNLLQTQLPKMKGGIISNAPSSGDIFRLRQLLKKKQ